MDKKTAYVEKLSAQLVELERQLDDLNYKADIATSEMKSGYCREIEAIQQQWRGVSLKLQKIGTASDGTWHEMDSAADDVWAEIRHDLHDTIVEIK